MELKDDLKVEVVNIAKEISVPFTVILLKYLEVVKRKVLKKVLDEELIFEVEEVVLIKIPEDVLIAFAEEVRELLNELEARKISYELRVD